MTDRTHHDQGRRKSRRRRFGSVIRISLPSGTVVWQARWRPARGAPRKERNFATKKAAEEYLEELVREQVAPASPGSVEKGDVGDPAPEVPTFVEFAREVLERRIAPVRSAATSALYAHNLAALSGFFGARTEDGEEVPAARLDEITPTHVLAFRAWRKGHSRRGRKTPLSNASVNRDLQFLSVILSHAVTDGVLPRHPLAGVKGLRLREDRTGRRWLTKEEAARLIRAAKGDFRAFVVAGLTTGCRISELAALRWEDLDFEGQRIHVVRKKTGKPDALPLHPDLRRELVRIRKRRPTAAASDPIFLNRRGNPWSDVRKSWDRTLQDAGIPGRKGLSPHSMRHSFATHFLEGGGAISDLQRQLGHSDVSTTMRYAALVDRRRRDTVFALNYSKGGGEDAPQEMGATMGATRPKDGAGVVRENAA